MLQAEIEHALSQERIWRKHLQTGGMDSGSYCEQPGNDYAAAIRIVSLYRQLNESLLAYERAGHKLPKDMTHA